MGIQAVYPGTNLSKRNLHFNIEFYNHKHPQQSLDFKTSSSIFFNKAGSSLPLPSLKNYLLCA